MSDDSEYEFFCKCGNSWSSSNSNPVCDDCGQVANRELPNPQAAIAALQERIAKLEEQNVRSVELLRPQPGDVVLVKLPDALHANSARRREIASAFQAMCGPRVKIAVMPARFSVQVVREDAIPGPGFEHHQAHMCASSGTPS